MRHNQPGRGQRDGFTLVEMLIVLTIILVLVSLLAGAVLRALVLGPQVKTQSDLSQFDVAIQAFESEFGVNYIPSKIVLREDGAYQNTPLEQASLTYLKRLFGKQFNPANNDWNGNGKIDTNTAFILEGQHCLVFFLGGVPAPGNPNGVLGFSTSPTTPAPVGLAASNVTRRGPFFTFEPRRLIAETAPTATSNAVGFFKYLDAWKSPTPQPYAYFSAYGKPNGYSTSDCTSLGLSPYQETTAPAAIRYTNPNTHQVISAGQDGQFGPGGLWNPTTGWPSPPGKDDQANFARGVLGSKQ